MSQENAEVVQSIYRLLNDGDWDAAFRLVDPEFEATFQRSLNRGTHRGRDSVRAIIEDQRAAFDRWVIEVDRLDASGDQVVALIRNRVQPKGTDVEVQTRNGHIWTIRDGVAVSWRGFPNPDEALEAAGLSK
jgi:ketosteroid isomerase-like protein